jgi:hypothetical protein
LIACTDQPRRELDAPGSRGKNRGISPKIRNAGCQPKVSHINCRFKRVTKLVLCRPRVAQGHVTNYEVSTDEDREVLRVRVTF